MNLYRTSPDIVRLPLNDHLYLVYYNGYFALVEDPYMNHFLEGLKGFFNV